jgi:hypothetical protein
MGLSATCLMQCVIDFSEETEHHRYPYSNMIVLTDDNPDPRSQPTRKNLLNAMRWLVEDARPDDALFIHCEWAGALKYAEI